MQYMMYMYAKIGQRKDKNLSFALLFVLTYYLFV